MIRGYGHTGLNFMSTEMKKESSYVGSAFARHIFIQTFGQTHV